MKSYPVNQKPTQTPSSLTKYQRLDVEQAKVEHSPTRVSVSASKNQAEGEVGSSGSMTRAFSWVRANPGKALFAGVCVAGGTAAVARAAQAVGNANTPEASATLGTLGSANMLVRDLSTSVLDSFEKTFRKSLEKYTFARLNTVNNQWEAGNVVNGTFVPGHNSEADKYIENGALNIPIEQMDSAEGSGMTGNDLIGSREPLIVPNSANEPIAISGHSLSIEELAQHAAQLFAEKYPNATLVGETPSDVIKNLRQQGINPFEILDALPKTTEV